MAVALSGCELVDALSPKQPPAETPATRLLVSQGCRTTPEYAGCAVWSGDANHLFVVTYNVPSGAVVDSLLVIDVSPTVGRTFQRSIGITSSLFALAAARDGSVLYFTRKTQGAPSFDEIGRAHV